VGDALRPALGFLGWSDWFGGSWGWMARLLALSRRGRVEVDLGCVASTSGYSPSKTVPTSLSLFSYASLHNFLFCHC
jgi:hypothetical protein